MAARIIQAPVERLARAQTDAESNPNRMFANADVDALRGRGAGSRNDGLAGLAALILARYPDLTNEQVREALRNTVDDLGTPGFDPYFGYGRINADSALRLDRVGPLAVAKWTIDDDGIAPSLGNIARISCFQGLRSSAFWFEDIRMEWGRGSSHEKSRVRLSRYSGCVHRIDGFGGWRLENRVQLRAIQRHIS